MIVYYPIPVVSAPRQVRRDRWKPSPHVLKYRAFRDECALRRVRVPEAGGHVLFLLEVPRSLSKREREARLYQGHRQKPDNDNLQKALLDAVHRGGDDAGVWDLRTSKVWAPVPGFIVSDRPIDLHPLAVRQLLRPIVGST